MSDIFELASPQQLAKRRLSELSTPAMQMAWSAIHYRPISAQWKGQPPFWPCTFCSKVEKG